VAARRKVGNLVALAILSTLLGRPMHPYEMASVMRARGKDRDMAIKWGSLYRVVDNLERHGLIEAVQSERRGGRPERTVYRITDEGRAELVDWTRELIRAPEPTPTPFKAGLSVAGVLTPDEVADLLHERIATLDRQIEQARTDLAGYAAEVPRVFLVESEYELAMWEAETAWVRGLLREITEGTLPGVDAWRAYHRTGEVPPEIAALAETGAEPNRDRRAT
jgi:DNA-binding PadR family transcriptional regulator